MIFSFFYELCLFLIALAYLPVFLYQLIFKGKYRKSILKRLGSGFPVIKKEGRPLIWIHAPSMGETKAVAALVKQLKADFHHSQILFSTTTETGYTEACRNIAADYHAYLPFDFGWVIKSIVKRAKPDLVILCESDFWYNFLAASKKEGAMVVLVNGKLSVRSMERFVKVPFFAKKLFSCIDLFCLQSNTYKKRFEKLDIPPEKLVVTGNMKFDGDYARLPQEQLSAWRQELGINPTSKVLVVGSSHNPEETQILKAMSEVWAQHPDLKLMIVPRHPERFNEVAGILQKSNISFRRLSQKDSNGEQPSVILIDAMGLLRKCYQLADIAIVAGSYTPRVGGHNILEPSWYGVPVVFGPHMHTQPDLVELVNEYGAGLQVPMEELPKVLLKLLADKEQRKTIGEAGLRLAGDVHGATSKTLKLLEAKATELHKPF